MKVLVAVAFAALLFGVIAVDVTRAQSSPKEAKVKVNVTPRLDQKGRKVPGQLLVVASLETSDGKPLSDQSFEVFERGQFMGALRDAKVGTAMTDSTGVGAVLFQPAVSGRHTLVARSQGNSEFVASEGTATIEASEVIAPFPEEPQPLTGVRRWLGISVGFVGVVFWAVVLGMFVRTVLGIRAAAPALLADGMTASATVSVPEIQDTFERGQP
jgi:hypothetical protein